MVRYLLIGGFLLLFFLNQCRNPTKQVIQPPSTDPLDVFTPVFAKNTDSSMLWSLPFLNAGCGIHVYYYENQGINYFFEGYGGFGIMRKGFKTPLDTILFSCSTTYSFPILKDSFKRKVVDINKLNEKIHSLHLIAKDKSPVGPIIVVDSTGTERELLLDCDIDFSAQKAYRRIYFVNRIPKTEYIKREEELGRRSSTHEKNSTKNAYPAQ